MGQKDLKAANEDFKRSGYSEDLDEQAITQEQIFDVYNEGTVDQMLENGGRQKRSADSPQDYNA
ncbi:DUF4025 domain-containing protein [Pullulanibacillus sp. KACC 23026]|uniref:DUF4025 domain-containing protein n=1 Tax=Pullulanibacillus sp. KACC 23026 TaxID=3028315 RepID=UPI0023AF00B8|nr:DUF4025 domain-containing protein [Pullulanibacillus sp. KACC 23026]WEG13810.1 DUF4025 domain-containing protein [Pullulanibacillus sp. KACC 23026]